MLQSLVDDVMDNLMESDALEWGIHGYFPFGRWDAQRSPPKLPRVHRSINRNTPQINQSDLVMVAVMGQIAHPVGAINAYRIGHDGIPRVLPATGGIVLNHRIGDRCVGLAGDHIEPGVALHNNNREVVGSRRGPNLALITYACVGNRAVVISGPCTGKQGLVTGKHGGIDHVLVDFPPEVLHRLQIGDRVQIYSHGLGLRLIDYPDITVTNCSPALLNRWGIRETASGLQVPVTHKIPAALMGSGLGKNTVWRGDVDIQLFDEGIRRHFRLGSLRFGDLVAIVQGDARFGPALRQGRTTIGVIVHGDSTVSGHGPGVAPLLTGANTRLQPIYDAEANLAVVFGIRMLPPARSYQPITMQRSQPETTHSYGNFRRQKFLPRDGSRTPVRF